MWKIVWKQSDDELVGGIHLRETASRSTTMLSRLANWWMIQHQIPDKLQLSPLPSFIYIYIYIYIYSVDMQLLNVIWYPNQHDASATTSLVLSHTSFQPWKQALSQIMLAKRHTSSCYMLDILTQQYNGIWCLRLKTTVKGRNSKRSYDFGFCTLNRIFPKLGEGKANYQHWLCLRLQISGPIVGLKFSLRV